MFGLNPYWPIPLPFNKQKMSPTKNDPIISLTCAEKLGKNQAKYCSAYPCFKTSSQNEHLQYLLFLWGFLSFYGTLQTEINWFTEIKGICIFSGTSIYNTLKSRYWQCEHLNQHCIMTLVWRSHWSMKLIVTMGC